MEGRWGVLTVTTIGTFMASLDASLLVVGLPVVLSELGAGIVAGSWLISIYRLALATLLIPVGRLGDMYGRAKLYSLGYFIFAVSSLLCALSSNIHQLLVFRLIQGVGGAFIFVNSMAIVTDAFADRGLGLGIGVNQVAINAGTVVGYTLSGVIIQLYGWRPLFLVNVPIGIFGGLWARFRLRGTAQRSELGRFDWPGAIALSSSLSLLMLGLTSGSTASPAALAMTASSALLLAAFVIHERRVDQPMLDLSLFRIRRFAAGNLSNLLNGISFASLAFLISLYLEAAAGLTPLQAGLSLIPIDLTLILVGPVSGWLSDRVGARILSTVGLAISGVALLILSRSVSSNPDYGALLMGLALAGLGVGLFRSPNASSVMGSVPAERRGVAAGVRSTIINTSIALSIPFSIAVMSATTPLTELSAFMNGGAGASADYADLLRGVRSALTASATLKFAAAVISYLRE